jgi:hypothetical protein
MAATPSMAETRPGTIRTAGPPGRRRGRDRQCGSPERLSKADQKSFLTMLRTVISSLEKFEEGGR